MKPRSYNLEPETHLLYNLVVQPIQAFIEAVLFGS